MVLDDPFIELDASVKPSLLELLGRAANHQQIVFLTEDEDVASWAKIEALTGDLAVLEPSAPEPPPLPSRRSRAMH
jgi:ABC-type dipeptide/oligopeptide/nickel transport system ATPase subunit